MADERIDFVEEDIEPPIGADEDVSLEGVDQTGEPVEEPPKIAEEDDAEISEDDSEEDSREEQRRLNKLRLQLKEERAARERLEEKLVEIERNMGARESESIDQQMVSLQTTLREMYDEGDDDAAQEVLSKLMDLGIKKRVQEHQRAQRPNEQPADQNVVIPDAQQRWMERNAKDYTAENKAFVDSANKEYLALLNEGYDEDDSETYAELDRRLKPKQRRRAPPPTAAPDRVAPGVKQGRGRFTEEDKRLMTKWELEPDNLEHRAEYMRNNKNG